MWRSTLFLLPLLLSAGKLEIEIRQSEVWLVTDGQAKQLTHDGRTKGSAALSPSRNRMAYVEVCPEAEHCTPSVVILDLDGHRVQSFQPKHRGEHPCGSIISSAWTGETAVAAVCHINPSLNEYVEIDISTGKVIRDLLGYDFTPSPDGKLVAHVGWIIHFAPPYAQSEYLQVEHTIVYPLPQGMSPVEQIGLTPPPKVVQMNGPTYVGIHDFQEGLHWSPDSRRIAFIDCTYDWTPNHPATLVASDGKESGRRCSLVVVDRSGKAALFPLPEIPPAEMMKASVSWIDKHRLSFEAQGFLRTYSIP